MATQSISISPPPPCCFEIIDAAELARRWHVPVSWIREWTRSRAESPIPHVRLGRYRRFEWGSPQLVEWFAQRRSL